MNGQGLRCQIGLHDWRYWCDSALTLESTRRQCAYCPIQQGREYGWPSMGDWKNINVRRPA